jgi:hypothetical protein
MTGNREMGIYRRVTTTDIIINKFSYRPGEHNNVEFKILIHRLHNLPLNEANKTQPLLSWQDAGYTKEQIATIY